MTEPVTVYLVDDDASVADACRFLLEGFGYRVRYWSDGRRFLEEAELDRRGCVILDMRMPGLSGSDLHRELQRRGSTLGVVILTAHGDIGMAVEEMKHGAVDFLQKPVSGSALLEAVRASLERSGELASRHALHQRIESLSERERAVADLVCLGHTNRAIADRLHVAVRTVEVHRASAMRKLGAENTAEMVRILESGREG